jgi:hypothetical protein
MPGKKELKKYEAELLAKYFDAIMSDMKIKERKPELYCIRISTETKKRMLKVGMAGVDINYEVREAIEKRLQALEKEVDKRKHLMLKSPKKK